MVGYSRTTLLRKIGVRPGDRVYLDNVPETLDLDWPDDVTLLHRVVGAPVDIAWTFCPDRARLVARLDRLVGHIAINGMLWVSWPKKSSALAGDLDENIVRDLGLAAGVVDVKVAAVDETWSGLKFVRRLRDR